MPGLDATYAVAAIVAAVMRVCSLLKQAAASRQTQKLAINPTEKTMETNLLTALQGGPRLIYDEFEKNLASCGTSFAKGDGDLIQVNLY